MGTSLFFKEKVARLSSLLILFFATAYPQTSFSQTITYACHATPLETVVDDLSKQSGYHFMYSSNTVDVSQRVTLSVTNKSIKDVLTSIERQASVSFKLRDRHIIIKNNPKPVGAVASPSPGKKKVIEVTPPAVTSNDSLLMTSTSKTIPMRIFDSQATELENRLNKRILELQRLLGTFVPQNIPNRYVNRINFNNRHKGWYVSTGTYVGDRYSGLEFQAGLSYAYAVVAPHWSAERGFYAAYGIGNSLPLWGPFSLNTMYLYSGYTKSEVVEPHGRMDDDAPKFRVTDIQRYHQVKAALRYSFNSSFSLRAGPVFNYRNVTNEISLVPPPTATQDISEYRSGSTNSQFERTRRTHRSETWLGWDVSIQFRINFQQKN